MFPRLHRVSRLVVAGACVAGAGCASPARTAPSSRVRARIRRRSPPTRPTWRPALAGRLIGTPGNDSAAAYIARRYQSLGLRSLSSGYRQPFVAHPPVREGPRPSIATQNVFAPDSRTGRRVARRSTSSSARTSTTWARPPTVRSIRKRGAMRRGADDNASGRRPCSRWPRVSRGGRRVAR